jgi:hypothetical protein
MKIHVEVKVFLNNYATILAIPTVNHAFKAKIDYLILLNNFLYNFSDTSYATAVRIGRAKYNLYEGQ